jgi:hypothetical protein
MMKKVISVSIFGDNIKYLSGLKENIELGKYLYPDWIFYVYFNQTVPIKYIEELNIYSNVELVNMNNSDLPGMFWRFLPNDDENVEVFIVRDLDSRISIREAHAVYEWIASSKKLHIMRDHPHHHYKILGGMWGLKRCNNLNMKKEIQKYIKSNQKDAGLFERMLDMDFLSDILYPKFRFSKIVHASYHKYEFFVKNFVPERINNSFVGEIIGEDGIRTDHYKFIQNI